MAAQSQTKIISKKADPGESAPEQVGQKKRRKKDRFASRWIGRRRIRLRPMRRRRRQD